MLHLLMYFPIGILSGILGTLVGLASLISYTALLATGMPPVTANITNVTSQIFIGFGSFISSLKELKHNWKEAISYFILILVGGGVGSLIVTFESSSSFSKIVPFFILAAAILVLIPQSANQNNPIARRLNNGHFDWTNLILYLVIFIVGIYNGYFGAASGVIMIALLSNTSGESFPIYNAVRNVSLPAANITAIVVFMLRTTIQWKVVLPLGLGMFVGAMIGPIIVRHVNTRILKVIIGICAIGLAIDLFLKAYGIQI